MEAWIEQAMRELGYVGIGLLMLLETLFPPLPSEMIMPMAGFAAARDQLTLAGVVISGTAGSLLGALVLYTLGRKLGEERVTRWVKRHGRWVQLRISDVVRVNGWFRKNPAAAVLLSRLVPGLRSMVSLPAGTARLPLTLFVTLTAIGTAAWSGTLAFAGWFLGEQAKALEAQLGVIGTWMMIGIAVSVMFVMWRRWLEDRRAPAAPAGTEIVQPAD